MRIHTQRKKLYVIVSLLLAVFLLVLPTCLGAAGSTPLFLPAVTYDSGGSGPTSIAIADVNGDDKLDLVVANEGSSEVAVLLGNGDGTFRPAVSYVTGGIFTESVAVADVNGDTKPDLLVAIRCASSTGDCSGLVGVLLGRGDGTFQPVVNYGSGGQGADSVAVTDVNGDGKPDLLVANECSVIATSCPPDDNGVIGVLLGNGDGTFQPAVTYDPGGGSTRSLAAADVNGDGKPDLLVANCGRSDCAVPSTVGVLLGNGDGTFQPAVSYSTGCCNSLSVTVADVNSDGKPDLLVANACSIVQFSCLGDGSVVVLLGNGDGTFQPAVKYGSGGFGTNSVTAADVNGDGKPDLLVANFCGGLGNCTNGRVDVLIDFGDGTFFPAVGYSSGGFGTKSAAIADVNGDGKPDLLVGNSDSNTVGVLLNNTPFDTTPPVITLSATPNVLWPPNGEMVPVTVFGTITDIGSGVNAKSAAYAVKDEYGEVQPKGSIALRPGGNYSFTVLLQASRLGTDLDGRRYAVTVQVKDNAGNGGSKATVVTVPRDRGHRP